MMPPKDQQNLTKKHDILVKKAQQMMNISLLLKAVDLPTKKLYRHAHLAGKLKQECEPGENEISKLA